MKFNAHEKRINPLDKKVLACNFVFAVPECSFVARFSSAV